MQAAEDALPERGPRLGVVGIMGAPGPARHRLHVHRVEGAAWVGAARQIGIHRRLVGVVRAKPRNHGFVVVFAETVEAQPRVGRRAAALGQRQLGRADLTLHRAGGDGVGNDPAALQPASETTRLLLAERRQLVVIGGAEARLAVPDEVEVRHRQSVDAAIAARHRTASWFTTTPYGAKRWLVVCPSTKRR